MKLRAGAAIVLVAAAASARAASDPAAPKAIYRVSGVAISSRNGAPIPFCRVRLAPMEAGNAVTDSRRSRFDSADSYRFRRDAGAGAAPAMDGAVLADAHGRFTLEAPRPGIWRLTGIARGYRLQAYEQHDGFSSGVVLSESAPTASVTFRLAPDAVLSGVVFDEAGEPVATAQVQAQNVTDPNSAGNRLGAFAQTDDRGHYELSGLAPGAYRLRVDARPWYASTDSAIFSGRFSVQTAPQSAPAGSTLDPSLDVVYPPTWFPGTEDAAQADVIPLAGGEERQADFHLLPQPAATLTVPRTPTAEGFEEPRGFAGPIVFRASGDAFALPVGSMLSTPDAWQVGGLAPGTYQVRMPAGNGSPAEIREISIKRGGTVDLSTAVPLIHVDLHFEGDAGDRPQVVLTDVESGARFSTGGRQRDLGNLFVGRQLSGRPLSGRQDENQSGISIPPGRYRVSVTTSGDTYLSGMTADGTALDPAGTLQINDKAVSLTLRMAAGKAGLSGMAHLGRGACGWCHGAARTRAGRPGRPRRPHHPHRNQLGRQLYARRAHARPLHCRRAGVGLVGQLARPDDARGIPDPRRPGRPQTRLNAKDRHHRNAPLSCYSHVGIPFHGAVYFDLLFVMQ